MVRVRVSRSFIIRLCAPLLSQAIGYPEFLKFATDFDLSNSVILSTLEIGDIFLSSIRTVDHGSTIRKLTFPEFWEALVRCALVAYSKISDSSVIDKIRGLFLYMWRAINRSVPRAFAERRNVSTYAGDLLAGAMLFNKRFTAAWAADGYRDYLAPDAPPLESGKAVLTRMLRRGAADGGAAGHMTASDAALAGGADVFGASARSHAQASPSPRDYAAADSPPMHSQRAADAPPPSYAAAFADAPLYRPSSAAAAAYTAGAGSGGAAPDAPLVYYGSGRVERAAPPAGRVDEYGY